MLLSAVPYNSDIGHAAPPPIQKGLTSENPPMALYPPTTPQATLITLRYPALLGLSKEKKGTLSLTLDRDSSGDSVSVNASLSRLNGMGGVLKTLYREGPGQLALSY